MIVRLIMSPEQYYERKDRFEEIRNKPRCDLQCPLHRPAKSRCKRCEYSHQFKYRRNVPGWDHVWVNPDDEWIRANYIRDQATDKLEEVRIEYESPRDESDPSEAYRDFEAWFRSVGVEPEPPEELEKHPYADEINAQLALFDEITANKTAAMRRGSSLRPPAGEGYISAFIEYRQKRRSEFELELKREYGG